MSLENKRKQALTYLKESQNYIYFAALLFLFFIVVGIVFQSKLGFLDEIIKNLVSKVVLLEGFDVGIYIFLNNSWAAFVGILGGALFGLLPLINIITNGTVIGYVFARVSQEVGFWEIWKILPHGIFELPAIFIALGLGIKLGTFVFSKDPWNTFKQRLYLSMLVFVLIIVPLLLLAACIEGMLIDIFE